MRHYEDRLRTLQPTQNPFRDWNKISGRVGFNGLCHASTNPKPFQGLKHDLIGVYFHFVNASTNPKPFQGLKLGSILPKVYGDTASTNPKPFQGLKLHLDRVNDYALLASTNPKPFQGLKRTNSRARPGSCNGFNQPKTLSGIETGSLLTPLHKVALQPTQNPFRDWNMKTENILISDITASTNPKPFQGLKQARFCFTRVSDSRASTNPKPFQGLKLNVLAAKVLKIQASTNPKPFQGLKPLVTAQ